MLRPASPSRAVTNVNVYVVVSLSGTLAGSNEGGIGPGHCDDGPGSSTGSTGTGSSDGGEGGSCARRRQWRGGEGGSGSDRRRRRQVQDRRPNSASTAAPPSRPSWSCARAPPRCPENHELARAGLGGQLTRAPRPAAATHPSGSRTSAPVHFN
ncbi:hypothetical protein [Sorangium sp. So ce1000]|uniref:hypothetical protein n=1 Tax=Sorangium sp. So ce1000 TaxID=3133325 RepID=UPI003F5EF299